MADKNLSDDMVKLVKYSIVCIERDRERILECSECKIFADNLTECDFETWVIADYVRNNDQLRCKMKYLRVSYEVLERWPRQDLQFEEKQLKRLRGIRDAILARDIVTDEDKERAKEALQRYDE